MKAEYVAKTLDEGILTTDLNQHHSYTLESDKINVYKLIARFLPFCNVLPKEEIFNLIESKDLQKINSVNTTGGYVVTLTGLIIKEQRKSKNSSVLRTDLIVFSITEKGKLNQNKK
jgi:hypothetical protein